ncbi:hypothetical protein B0H13DRAFT_1854993 [Mycena leptocephala]|nr:hypothetical protein B0H13DRAFT_1854993 [Mycena leptocephala]
MSLKLLVGRVHRDVNKPASAWRMELRLSYYASNELLDFNTQVLVLIWLKSDELPLQRILYPREDLRVRLADHLSVLRGIGVNPEVPYPLRHSYQDDYGSWSRCGWDTPLKVSAPGDVLLIAVPGLTRYKAMQLRTQIYPHFSNAHNFELYPPPTMSNSTPTQTTGDTKILDQSFTSTVDVVKVNEATAARGLLNFTSPVDNVNEATAGLPEVTGDLQHGERSVDIDTCLHIFQEAHPSGAPLVTSHDVACQWAWKLEKMLPMSEDQLRVRSEEGARFERLRLHDRHSIEVTSAPEDWEEVPELEELSDSDSE